MLMLLWDGTTQERFFANFQRAREEMKLTIEHMQFTSWELKNIAYRFMQVDGENGELDTRCAAPVEMGNAGPETKKEQTRQNELNGFWDGIKSGGKMLADSIGESVEALIEDPVGTAGTLAYNCWYKIW